MVIELESYLPIVFAGGGGNRMLNLTEHICKARLPVANIPLYWYPLNLLHRNGFKHCLLIIPEAEYDSIQNELNNLILPELKDLKVEILSVTEDKNENDDFGTADVCRHFLDRLNKENILLVSGDFVSDLNLEEMLKFHEEKNSIFTCLLSDSALSGPVPGSIQTPSKYRDLIMFAPDSHQLFYMIDEEDYGDIENIPLPLFHYSPNIVASAKFKDVHIYAMKQCALSALSKDRTHSSIKADLIPELLHGQISMSKRRALGLSQPYKCYAYFPSKEYCSLLSQCNNIGAYFEANKAVIKILSKIHSGLETKHFDKKSGVNCIESLVSQNVTVEGKCQIKRSVIAERCIIGKGAKIDNSILMPSVVIHDCVTVKNSIIFTKAELDANADLYMCVVAPRQKVQEKLTYHVVDDEKKMDINE